MSLSLHLSKKLVFAFGFLLDAHIVLRNAPQHIGAFANVHNRVVQLDAVNTCVLILGRQSFAGEPSIHIVHIVFLYTQYTNSFIWIRSIFVLVVG